MLLAFPPLAGSAHVGRHPAEDTRLHICILFVEGFLLMNLPCEEQTLSFLELRNKMPQTGRLQFWRPELCRPGVGSWEGVCALGSLQPPGSAPTPGPLAVSARSILCVCVRASQCPKDKAAQTQGPRPTHLRRFQIRPALRCSG